MRDDVLVSVIGLTKSFRQRGSISSRRDGKIGVVNAVIDVSFMIARGKTLGLVGESGSGKSTTGYILSKLLHQTSGTYLFDGNDVSEIHGPDMKRFRKSTQIIFQDPSDSLNPRHTVQQIISEPLAIHRIGTRAERLERVNNALEMVELRPPSTFAQRFPSELSGGQRQRVAIARAIVVEPAFIIADEPVSMLDVSVRLGLMNLMLRLQDELGVAYLFITHDLSVARYLCHNIAVMKAGRIVEIDEATRILDHPKSAYTQALRAAVSSPGEVAARFQADSSVQYALKMDGD